MGGAGKRDLPAGQAEPVGGAGFDQRQGQERLHRRAGIDGAVDVTGLKNHRPIGVQHHGGATMGGFDAPAPRDLHKDLVSSHGAFPKEKPAALMHDGS